MTIASPATRSGLRRRPLALCLAVILAAPATPALAATITVSNCADAGAGSLRDAAASAISGDTIDFSATLDCSTISLTSGAVTIGQGGDGQPIVNLTIDGPGRDALTLAASGGSRIECAGTVSALHVEASGGSTVTATAQRADLDVSGGSQISITADVISGAASGGSTITANADADLTGLIVSGGSQVTNN